MLKKIEIAGDTKMCVGLYVIKAQGNLKKFPEEY